MSTQNTSTSPLFGGPWCYGGWSIAAVATTANDIATRVVHTSDIDTADFGAVGDAISKATVDVGGTNESMQAGRPVVQHGWVLLWLVAPWLA